MADAVADRMAALRLAGKQKFIERLLAAGAVHDEAEACWKLFGSVEEALPYVNTPDDGRRGYKNPWQEYYSLRYQRFYYCNDALGYNSWDMPPCMQLAEWMLDTGLYGVDVTLARDAYAALRAVTEPSWHRTDALWRSIEVMSKVVGNVTGCGNSLEKYRVIKLDNVKVKESVLSLPGAEALLRAAGFVKGQATLSFPAPPAAQDGPAAAEHARTLRTAGLFAAKLQQLSARKGFTGGAKEVNDTAGTSFASKHSGKPGFKYQQVIIECSLCERPINDGTDRLRIKSHDTPCGEFRYECQTCPSFNLCESCWDRHTSGQGPLHERGHTFRTVHPHESQHGLHAATSGAGGSDDSNPWGTFRAAPAGRALQRLGERHGIREWL